RRGRRVVAGDRVVGPAGRRRAGCRTGVGGGLRLVGARAGGGRREGVGLRLVRRAGGVVARGGHDARVRRGGVRGGRLGGGGGGGWCRRRRWRGGPSRSRWRCTRR